MKRFLSLTLCLAMVAAASMAFAATSGTVSRDSAEQLHYTRDLPGVVYQSSTSVQQLAARETAGPDTFALFGGPDHLTEGKFQQEDGGTPDWGDGLGIDIPGPTTGFGPGAWDPRDMTDQPVYWHVDTFNAENLNSNGVGNKAFWSGVPLNDPLAETWVHPQGYGNGWFDIALYESASLGDTVTGETVALDFVFNYDLEPGWDFFVVEYDSANTWVEVASVTSSNLDTSNNFPAPGVAFTSIQTHDIVYTGGDYGGTLGDQIRIRLIVDTDGGWSDQDGAFQSIAGAVQVDDISLTHQGGTFNEDYETVPGPGQFYLFDKDKAPFAGDFAEVYSRLTDVDPCRDNLTPVIGFIDTGQDVRNGPALDGITTNTGGATSPNIQYGVPGSWVVNYEGGLSFEETSLANEIWSPEILWDLPGTDDDAAEISGSYMRWSAWYHGPIDNGMFFYWGVRSAAAGNPYGAWFNRGFLYYTGEVPLWGNSRQDFTDLLVSGPERLQIALGVYDMAEAWDYPGLDGTPFPCYDNVAVYKYRIGGPSFSTREIDYIQDAFPASGSIDVSTAAARAGLDVPFNMGQDIRQTGPVEHGDSLVIRSLTSVIPGADVVDIRMYWALKTNPLFTNADQAGTRVAPAGPLDQNVVAGAAGTIWTGEAVADTVKNSAGQITANRYFFNLPDVDFMYPGDVLHWYAEAVDNQGRTTTLPGNTEGFMDFTPGTVFNRAYIVRALPTITTDTGTQPSILFWDDSDRRFGGQYEYQVALGQLGYAEGVDYDVYYTNGPTSNVGNGLAAFAVTGQLANYEHLFYLAGDLDAGLLSDGSNLGSNEKTSDIALLTAWHALAGTHNGAYFGDYIVSAMINDAPTDGLTFVTDVLGVQVGDSDVKDVIGGQFAPKVVPHATGDYGADFSTEYFVFGGCLNINEFDQIQPVAGADAGHLWVAIDGTPYPPAPLDVALNGVASVVNPLGSNYAMTFPYANFFIRSPNRTVGNSAKSQLFAEILGLMGAPAGTSPITSAPKATKAELSVYPNPFNPSTVVKFTAALGSNGSVKVFNLRGELVKTLHSGNFSKTEFEWDGTDNRGASVASGVYVIQAQAGSQVQTKKAALVK